jgi:hypothetical protein
VIPVRPRIQPVSSQAEEAAVLKSVSPHLEEIGQLGRNHEWGKLRQPVQEVLRTSKKLPPDLRETLGATDQQARRMQSIDELEMALSADKLDPARVDSLKRNAVALLEATGEPELAELTQKYLSLKAELAADNLKPDAAARFRDLKKTLLNEGRTSGDNAEASNWWTVPLIPEAPAKGPRVMVEESTLKDLPSLKKAMQAADKQLRAQLRKRIEAKAQGTRYYLGQNLARLQQYSRLGKQGQDDEKKKKVRNQWQEQPAATVARLLGRPLTPGEKILVPLMLRQGEQPAGISRIFRGLDRAAAKS